MAEFMSAVEKVASQKKETYFTVSVEISKYSPRESKCKFKCYINGYGFHEGETPLDCLKSLRKITHPKKSNIKDVEVMI